MNIYKQKLQINSLFTVRIDIRGEWLTASAAPFLVLKSENNIQNHLAYLQCDRCLL